MPLVPSKDMGNINGAFGKKYLPETMGAGCAFLDYNNDGWQDILLINGMDWPGHKRGPSYPALYRNNKNGTFSERGVTAGVAFSEDGTVRGAMGVDAADYDGSGLASLVIGNFSDEMLNLYHNEGNGPFLDEAPSSTLGQASLLILAFGCLFFDVDLDGKTDIFVADGHVENDINKVQKRVTYAQSPHLFHNLGNKQFAEITAQVGPSLRIPKVARGCAYADIDNDGDLDILVTTNEGPAYLYRNDGGNTNHFLRVKTVGTRSNRDGIGAVVRLKLPGGTLWGQVKSGGSYCSQSELPLTFGLGKQTTVPILEVSWPSGAVDRFFNVAANQTLIIKEGTGSR